MARIRPFDWDELDRRAEKFTDQMVDAMRDVLTDVAPTIDEQNPLRELNARMTQLWERKVNDELMPELRSTLDEAADDVQTQLQEAANTLAPAETAAIEPAPGALEIPPVRNEEAERYLASRRNFLVNFADAIWTVVRRLLVEGVEEGESVGELQDRILSVSDMTRGRAERVARTEVVGASNAGALEQMEVAELEATKEWLATNDQRTRVTHRDVDGQVVDLNENFIVGGFPMSRPGDPIAPVQELVNCRCTMVFDVADEQFHLSGQHDQRNHGRSYVRGNDIVGDLDANLSDLEELSANQPAWEDAMLTDIARRQDWKTPILGTADEVQERIDEGWIEIFRGVRSSNEATAAEIVDGFKQDDDYSYGKGMWGNGLYFSADRDEARSYGDDNDDNVIRVALRNDANIIKQDDLFSEFMKFYSANRDRYSSAMMDVVLGDPGRWAAAMGYDAIDVTGKMAGHYIVLNRTALIVEE